MISWNNKTNSPWTSQDLNCNIPSQKLVNHETHTVFLVCEVNDRVILFSCEWVISGRLLLLRLKYKLKLWLQNKRICTPFPWPLRRLSYKPPRLKQHHCNKSREFKILQQMSSEYLLSAPPYHNWLLFVELVIHGTGVRAFTCRWVVGEMNHDAWLVSFFVRKKVLVNNLDKTCYFRKQERSL